MISPRLPERPGFHRRPALLAHRAPRTWTVAIRAGWIGGPAPFRGATAGAAEFALLDTDALRALGAKVTNYGDGVPECVSTLAGGPVDIVLDAGPVGNQRPPGGHSQVWNQTTRPLEGASRNCSRPTTRS